MPWAGAEGEPGATPALLLFYTPRSKIETNSFWACAWALGPRVTVEETYFVHLSNKDPCARTPVHTREPATRAPGARYTHGADHHGIIVGLQPCGARGRRPPGVHGARNLLEV